MRRLVFAFLFIFVALPLYAINTGDTEVILPIVIRGPGAAGIIWHTDVLIASHYTPTHPMTLVFYPSGGSPIERTITIPPYGMVALRDAVRTTFGLTRGWGQLSIRSTIGVSLEARARVYGLRMDGTQVVQEQPGLGVSTLRRQAFLYGLRGNASTRINIGVTNPNDASTTVTFRVTDVNGAVLHQHSEEIAARQTRQIADLFGTYDIPRQDVQVEMFTLLPVIYGFAFEVRLDSQDVTFVFGTSPNT